MWEEPICDRSTADVSALRALHSKILDGILSPAEWATWLDVQQRGALNIKDLNRIETNCVFLKQKLLEYGYTVHLDVRSQPWLMEDFLYAEDIERIRSNVQALVDAFYTLYPSPVITSNYNLDITDINELEQNLLNVNILLDYMIAYFRKSGTFRSGQGVILP